MRNFFSFNFPLREYFFKTGKSSLLLSVYFIYCTIVAYLQCQISYHIFRSCLLNDKLFLNSILRTLGTLED